MSEPVHLVIHGVVCCGAAVPATTSPTTCRPRPAAGASRRTGQHRAVFELRGRRYGIWGGRPAGTERDPDRCAEEIHAGHKGQQCRHGPGREYCAQHGRRYRKQEKETWNR